MYPPPTRSTRTYTPFPYTTLFRSFVIGAGVLLPLEKRHHQLGAGQRLGQVAAQAVFVLPGFRIAGLLVGERDLHARQQHRLAAQQVGQFAGRDLRAVEILGIGPEDRKSTSLNSSP